jgi:hypothetical protein
VTSSSKYVEKQNSVVLKEELTNIFKISSIYVDAPLLKCYGVRRDKNCI